MSLLNRRRALQWMGATACASTMSAPALAQSGKTIRLLVGFPAGGGTDAIARLLGEHLKDELGAPVAPGTVAVQQAKTEAVHGVGVFLLGHCLFVPAQRFARFVELYPKSDRADDASHQTP